MSFFIDGTTSDYPQGVGRCDGLDLGQINCARVDHAVQEAVDPETGETHAISRMFPDPHGGPPNRIRQWRGGWDDEGNEILPNTPGVCYACWLEQHDPSYAQCPLHGSNRKLMGVDECPICALDPKEKAACKKLVKDIEASAAIQEPEAEATGEAAPGPVVFLAHDPAVLVEALARRRSSRIILAK